MTRREELALTREEVDEILSSCGRGVLLVGGQALAFWATHYRVEPVGELSGKITSDVDLIGTAAEARRLGARLQWTLWFPTMDDATAQTAKLTKRGPRGGVKQIDYLSGIVGLDTAKIQARAVDVLLSSGATIRVLHPLDVLESRLRNLATLASKQNAIGVAQARMATAVVNSFVRDLIDSAAERKTVHRAVERIVKIALDRILLGVAVEFGIDVLGAVPAARIDSPGFRTKRWPQILARYSESMLEHTRRAGRRSAVRKPRGR